MFPFSLPVLIKEKTELVDFDVLEALFANANDVFCYLFLVVQKSFCRSFIKRPIPEFLHLRE